MAQPAKGNTQWRSYGRDFVGEKEVRYEEFELGGMAPSGAGEGHVGGAHGGMQRHMMDAEMLLQDKHNAREEEKEQKMAGLRKKIRDFQKRQMKLEERKKEREMEMAIFYAAKVEQDKLMRQQERQARLEEMRFEKERAAQREAEHRSSGEQQPVASGGHRASGGHAAETEDGQQQEPGHTWALTSSEEAGKSLRAVSPLPAKYRDKIRLPVPSDEQCATWKVHKPEMERRPRLPPEACPSQRRKKAQQQLQQKASKGEKSVVARLPELFPGLRRTVEGTAILAGGEGAGRANGPGQDPEQSFMPKKTLLRRAQIKLMHQLSDQVSFYRDHMKRNFQRILAATELEFGDVQGRRQQAAWNLAKPLTISEIKQMSAVKIG